MDQPEHSPRFQPFSQDPYNQEMMQKIYEIDKDTIMLDLLKNGENLPKTFKIS